MELGLLMNGGQSAAANHYPSLEDGYKSLPMSPTLLSHLSVPFLHRSQSLSHDNLTQSVENLLAVIGSDFNAIRVDVHTARFDGVRFGIGLFRSQEVAAVLSIGEPLVAYGPAG